MAFANHEDTDNSTPVTEDENVRRRVHRVFNPEDGTLSHKFQPRSTTPLDGLFASFPEKFNEHAPKGIPVIKSARQFETNLEAFSCGVLRFIDWTGACVGGGAVSACLHQLPQNLTKSAEEYNEICEILHQLLPLPIEIRDMIITYAMEEEREWVVRGIRYHYEVYWDYSDIDIFFYAATHDEALSNLSRVCSQITENIRSDGRDFRLIRSRNAITILCGYPVRNIQLVLLTIRTPEELLHVADLDCTAVLYDGNHVVAAERCVRAFNTGWNQVPAQDMYHRERIQRIIKYRRRGFGTLFVCGEDSPTELSLPEFTDVAPYYSTSLFNYHTGITLDQLMETVPVNWAISTNLDALVEFDADNLLRWKTDSSMPR